MVVNASLVSSGTNILSIILGNKELARMEYPLEDKISILAFDLIDNIRHSRSLTPSKYAIENGSTITDHIMPSNKTASFDIVISDTPLIGMSTLTNIFGTISTYASKARKIANQASVLGAGSIVQKASKLAGSVVDGTFIRSQDTFDLLEELMDKKILITAVVGFKKYTNACITSLEVLEEKSNENSLAATITIEEINIVKNSTVEIPAGLFEKKVAHTAPKTAKTGKQAPKSIAGKVKEKAEEKATILYKLLT